MEHIIIYDDRGNIQFDQKHHPKYRHMGSCEKSFKNQKRSKKVKIVKRLSSSI